MADAQWYRRLGAFAEEQLRSPRSETEAADRLDRGGRPMLRLMVHVVVLRCFKPHVSSLNAARLRSSSSSSSTGLILRPGNVFSTRADALTLAPAVFCNLSPPDTELTRGSMWTNRT